MGAAGHEQHAKFDATPLGVLADSFPMRSILQHPGTPCIFYDHLFSDGGRRATGVWGSLKRLLSAGSMKVGSGALQQQGCSTVSAAWQAWSCGRHVLCAG